MTQRFKEYLIEILDKGIHLDDVKDDEIDDLDHKAPNPPKGIEDTAERFMHLQNKVLAMIPQDEFPENSEEMMALNRLIYDNILEIRTDIPRNVITRWKQMAPTRKARELENPYNYT